MRGLFVGEGRFKVADFPGAVLFAVDILKTDPSLSAVPIYCSRTGKSVKSHV